MDINDLPLLDRCFVGSGICIAIGTLICRQGGHNQSDGFSKTKGMC